MATAPATKTEHGHAAASPQEATNKDEAKKAINHADGHGDPPVLTENQLTRAASEYMIAMRPQPTPAEMEAVLKKIVEKDEKGELKHKCKSTDEVPALVDAALAELRK